MPLALLFAIGVFGFVIPSWTTAVVRLGKLSGINESWAGFAGAIISAAMTITATIAGAVIAWFAIKSQNRINILTREEERIERELPGLVEGSKFLSVLALGLSGYVSAHGALSVLSAYGFENTATGFLAEVKKWIPNSSDAFQRRLAGNLNAIWATAITLKAGGEAAERALINAQAEQAPPDYQYESIQRWKYINSDVSNQRTMLSQYVGLIISMNSEVAERIKRLEARLIICRSQIDRFFVEGE